MKNNSITFTSNIRFVDKPVYKMMTKNNFIGFHHSVPNILKAEEFYSEEIRTCTGGGLVIPFKEAEGFHFWDDLLNKKNFDLIINKLFRFVKNPEHGLLVGAKDYEKSPYSVEQFLRFKKVFLERVKNLSIFEKHKFINSETHYHYSLENDTWTLCASYREPNEYKLKAVKSLDSLKKCFEKISIAPNDRLFIGKKEILPTEAPEIFSSHACI